MEMIPQTQIEHPFLRGAVAYVGDIDGLARMLEVLKDQQARLRSCEYECRNALARLTTGETKTRRLVGDKYKLKLEFPSDYWNQSVLKKCVQIDPEQAEVYLRISKYDPNLREVGKLEACNGNERFESFKKLLLSARSPSNSPPSVTIEE